jgi:hypothetical protein
LAELSGTHQKLSRLIVELFHSEYFVSRSVTWVRFRYNSASYEARSSKHGDVREKGLRF